MNDLMVAEKDITGAVAILAGKEVDITKAITSIKIIGVATQDLAIKLKQDNQKFINLVHETFDSIVDNSNKLHKDAVAKRQNNLQPFEDNKKVIQDKLTDYMLAEQRRLQEEENKRQAKLRKEEQERRDREEAARLREAARLEKAGDAEGAQQSLNLAAEVTEQEIIVPTVDIKKQIKTSGVQMRTLWKFRVVDPKKINRDFLTVDTVKIGRTVTALRGDAAAMVGGIEVYSETKAI